MKDASRRKLYEEFEGEPRRTQYKLEFFTRTDDGLEPFETILMDNDPLLPSEGDYMSVEWFEYQDGDEVNSPIDRSEIGSDKTYEKRTSHSFEITDITTSYCKQNFIENDENISRVVVHKTIILELPQ